MIPYSSIKEVNPDEVKGSATGAINFIVFVISALVAPAYGWLLMKLSAGAPMTLEVFQEGGGHRHRSDRDRDRPGLLHQGDRRSRSRTRFEQAGLMATTSRGLGKFK